MSLIIHKSI